MAELECSQVHGRIRQAVANPSVLDDPSLAAHVDECPACALLLEHAATLGGSLAAAQDETQSELSLDEIDAMLEHLDAQLAARPRPVERVRQASTPTRGLVLFAATVGTIALTSTLQYVDFSSYPLPRVLGAIAALVAAILAASAVVLRPIHRRPLPSWLLGALAGFAVITPGVIASLPPPQGWTHPHPELDFWTGAMICFVFGMVFALLLVGVAWLVDRSGLRRRAATVLGLVGAGALANLLLVLHCPDETPLHKLAGHASISAVLLAAAGLLAWRWTLELSNRRAGSRR